MRMKKILSCVLAIVLLASAVPLAITPVAADLYYEMPGDINPHDDKLTKEELTGMILPYMLDEGTFTLDDVGDAAWVYAYWNGEPKTVMDANDREVTIYRPVERVVANFAMENRAVVGVGGCDRLVGITHRCVLPEEAYACGGKLLEVPYTGYHATNLEAIAAQRPDVVFGSSPGGIETFQEKVQALALGRGAEYAKLKKSERENHEDAMCCQLEFTGEVLDTQEKAEEIVSLIHEKYALVTDVTSQIPDNEKPKACLVSGTGRVSKVRSDWCSPFGNAGAITVEEDLGAREISVEQLIDWDPDFLFISNSGATYYSAEEGGFKSRPLSLTVEQVLEDPRLQSINAVKNGSVYYITGCCMSYPHQRIMVGTLYMAKIFYPEKLKDLDLEKEGNEIFEAWYGVDDLYTKMADELGYLREFIEESKK